MKRLLLLLAVLALTTAPVAPAGAVADGTAVDMRAYPETIHPGQIGTWVATRIGEWQPGTLSIYVMAQLAEPTYTSTPAGIVCTMAQSAAAFSLECDAPAGSATVALTARLVIASPRLHSVACGDDMADTYLAEDWQFTKGIATIHMPTVMR